MVTLEETLGISTNRHSTNWYVQIGNLVIAGCQIHYAVKCDAVNFHRVTEDQVHEGKYICSPKETIIYNADLN